MIQQPDSIVSSSGGVLGDSASAQHAPLTPRMVLSWLPRNATPAQQDSAIQAHFQPKEIHWSNRSDTLHLPGHDKGHNLLDTQLPQYYREGFFSKDSLFHPELPGGRVGVAGDPVPYNVHSDNIITSLLLLCFILAVVAFANAKSFILRQCKSFFYQSHGETTEIVETANELRFQVFLMFLTSILLALLFYFYTINHFGDTFVLDSLYYLIAIYLAIVISYFVFKTLLYSLINIVFFDGKRNGQWIKSWLFITSIEGTLLFPLVILQAYFGLSQENVEYSFVFVLSIVKIMTIYKEYAIFFKRNVVKLQIILYFCTLEIVPLLAFWGALMFTANSLKINF